MSISITLPTVGGESAFSGETKVVNALSTLSSNAVQQVASSTDDAIVRFNGTTGVLQNSGIIVDDNNNIKNINSQNFSTNSSVATPDSNTVAVYSKSDERIYRKGNVDTAEYLIADDWKTAKNRASIFYNGVGYAVIQDNDNLSFTDGTKDQPFFIMREVKNVNCASALPQIIYGKISTGQYEYQCYAVSNVLYARCFSLDGTKNISYSIPLLGLFSGKIWISYDGFATINSCKIYIDGVPKIPTFLNTGGYTNMSNGTSPLYMAYSQPSSVFSNYEDFGTKIFNRVLTQAEAQKYDSGSIDYADIGASNLDLTLGNGKFITDTTSWWTAIKGTFTWNSVTQDATFTSNNNTGENYISKSSLLVVNKKYRISFKAKSSNSTHIPTASGSGASYFSRIQGSNLSTDYQTYIYEGIATDSSLTLRLGTALSSGINVTIDDIVVQQIGCVLDLNPMNINSSYWYDNSGNNLHGTYVNAIPYSPESVSYTSSGEVSKIVKTDALGDIYERGNRVAEEFRANTNKPSIFLNGTDAYISGANNANINFGTGTFSIIHESTFESGSVNRYKFLKTLNNEGYYIRHDTSNKINVIVRDSINTWTITSTNTITDGKFHIIGFVKGIDSASSKLYIDGIEDTTAVKTGTFPTGTTTNTYPLYLGSWNTSFHKNETRLNRLFNYALTASLIQKYSYEDLAYEDVGGSNADLTLGNGSFATDTTGWWNTDSTTKQWVSTADAQGDLNYIKVSNATSSYLDIVKSLLTVGKRYRITYRAKSQTKNTQMEIYNVTSTFTTGTNPNLTTTFQNYQFEFVAVNAQMYIRLIGGAQGLDLEIDDIVVQQIGCVLNLTPDSIANTGWFDKSGNNLHATYTNALPFNLQNYKPRIQGYSADMRGANVAVGTSTGVTITPTGEIFHITGTGSIATINVPYTGFNGSITIIPDGIFTWTTAGNIALAGTAVVGKALIMTYDATTSKWYPSY